MAQYEISTPDYATMVAAQKTLGVWVLPDPDVPGDTGHFGTGGVFPGTTLAWAANIYGQKVITTYDTAGNVTSSTVAPGYFGILAWPDGVPFPTLPAGVVVIPIPDNSPYRFA